jgi:hypothetical protein
MLEWFIILGVIVCIVVWYYNQSATSYSLNQITERQVPTQLGELWQEKKPVVVLECAPNRIWVADGLRQTRFWGAQPVWGAYEENPGALVAPGRALEMTWAEILGIARLEEEVLLRWFNGTDWIFGTRTEAHIGPEGLREAYGYATAISVTQGTGRCILLHSAQKAKMPPGWKGLRWANANVSHHPLWTQIQFIEIVLRPGTTLLVPPHWIVAIESQDPGAALWWVRTDYHHPISKWAQKLNEGGT